jgi:hypothetical protein
MEMSLPAENFREVSDSGASPMLSMPEQQTLQALRPAHLLPSLAFGCGWGYIIKMHHWIVDASQTIETNLSGDLCIVCIASYVHL